MLALTMEISLEEAGYDVVLAFDGDAAITELDANVDRFSAVITDIRMPGSASGWDVGRRARELAQELPVLYISGDSAANWRKDGVPGSKMLTKPFSLDQAISFLDLHAR